MKKYFAICVPLIIAGLTACNQAEKKAVTGSDSVNVAKETTNDTLNVYNTYLQLKNSLVKTDAKAAQDAAGKLTKPLSGIEGCDESKELAGKIAAEKDIATQRKLFLQLSRDIIPLVKGMKVKQSPIYVAYCPMAGEGKGGYWLSDKREIENPYYGDDMMECGEVKETLK